MGRVLVLLGSPSSRPTVQVYLYDTNPRLRRCAPHLGLTVWHLSEVLAHRLTVWHLSEVRNCVTDLNVNCEL